VTNNGPKVPIQIHNLDNHGEINMGENQIDNRPVTIGNVGSMQDVDLSAGKMVAGGNLQNVDADGDAHNQHADDGLSQRGKYMRVLAPVLIAAVTAVVAIYEIQRRYSAPPSIEIQQPSQSPQGDPASE